MMKCLYAIQATGNGHLSRAMEVIPYLRKYTDVDLFVSGTESSLDFPHAVKYTKHGLSIYFGESGSLDLAKSIKHCRPMRFLRDIRSCPVKDYDLIINDFEPITAWAARRENVRCVSLSHQASFVSTMTPRPKYVNPIGEAILRYFAPAEINYGLHFCRYDNNIYLPIIRRAVRELVPETGMHYLVYLPSYSPMYLAHYLREFKHVHWRVFSKHVKEERKIENVHIFPVGNSLWLESLRTAKGVLIGAGFEGPAEALYLGKKLLVVPMLGQYEQLCNARALADLNVPVIRKLNRHSLDVVSDWLQSDEVPNFNYPDETDEIVRRIVFNPISANVHRTFIHQR